MHFNIGVRQVRYYCLVAVSLHFEDEAFLIPATWFEEATPDVNAEFEERIKSENIHRRFRFEPGQIVDRKTRFSDEPHDFCRSGAARNLATPEKCESEADIGCRKQRRAEKRQVLVVRGDS